MQHNLEKGKLGGKCNRGACPNFPATWYSSVENAHYCQPCAFKINDYCPPSVPKLVRVVLAQE